MKQLLCLSFFLSLFALTCQACGDEPEAAAAPEADAQEVPTPAPDNEAGGTDDSNETNMKIRLTVGEATVTATLENNGAARDLASRLPLTVTLRDFNRTEKIFYPDPALSLADTPRGCAPEAGDLTIYVPWGNVAIFYRPWSYSDDLVKLGHIDGDGVQALSGSGELRDVRIERVE